MFVEGDTTATSEVGGADGAGCEVFLNALEKVRTSPMPTASAMTGNTGKDERLPVFPSPRTRFAFRFLLTLLLKLSDERGVSIGIT